MKRYDLYLYLARLSLRRYMATICGHHTKRTGKVSAFGHTITTKMPINEEGSVDYCLDCIAKMAIRCAWCGNPIFIGKPITLYTPVSADFKIPEYAVVYEREPSLQLVGCLRWDCAETGADRAGFWVPGEDGKGRVERVPTVYEMIFAMKGSSMLLVNDTGDIAEARNPNIIPLEKPRGR
ncbi:MAG: hypothetical protein WC724_03065 [Candidatus Paceibacterota bacterium]|jgi:hypothetical protein